MCNHPSIVNYYGSVLSTGAAQSATSPVTKKPTQPSSVFNVPEEGTHKLWVTFSYMYFVVTNISLFRFVSFSERFFYMIFYIIFYMIFI